MKIKASRSPEPLKKTIVGEKIKNKQAKSQNVFSPKSLGNICEFTFGAWLCWVNIFYNIKVNMI